MQKRTKQTDTFGFDCSFYIPHQTLSGSATNSTAPSSLDQPLVHLVNQKISQSAGQSVLPQQPSGAWIPEISGVSNTLSPT